MNLAVPERSVKQELREREALEIIRIVSKVFILFIFYCALRIN